MSALAGEAAAVTVFVLDKVMVEDFSVFLVDADLSATHAVRLDWVRGLFVFATLDPVNHIKIVDVLFADVVTT